MAGYSWERKIYSRIHVMFSGLISCSTILFTRRDVWHYDDPGSTQELFNLYSCPFTPFECGSLLLNWNIVTLLILQPLHRQHLTGQCWSRPQYFTVIDGRLCLLFLRDQQHAVRRRVIPGARVWPIASNKSTSNATGPIRFISTSTR